MRSLVEVLHHLLVRVVDAGARLGRSDLGVAKLEKVIEERRGDGVVCKQCTRQECQQTAQVCLPRWRWEVKAGGARTRTRRQLCTRAHVRVRLHVHVRVRVCVRVCVRVGGVCTNATVTWHGVQIMVFVGDGCSART